jgi:ATP-dependent Clp protease adaptor protein ClpS
VTPQSQGPQTGVIEETETDATTSLAKPWKVIVHDDPITLMDYVTMTLRRIFGYPAERAHALMMEVHTQGRSIVWTGAREEAELYVLKLHAAQLLATMEPSEA